ncbi:MAG: SAM-dependent methyltransferase [Myxococcales bacterium]|nr:SAM-dependent methyltransferase [Myxococcales bacterium]
MSAAPSLSPRLAAIAELIPAGKVLADIGTDHALLPAALVIGGRIARAIACDRRPGPLAAARRTLALHGVEGQVSLRLGDGLGPLEVGEAEVVVIAGMGAESVRAILSEGAEVLRRVERLVLQPNSDVEAVRRWLVSRGWELVDERLVDDRGRFYTAVAAEAPRAGAGRSRPRYGPADWRLGPILRRRRGEVFERFVAAELRRYEAALAEVKRAPIPKPRRLAELAALRGLLLRELIGEGEAAPSRTC